MSLSGYLSSEYGESYQEFGEILTLPNSGVQVIKRAINKDYFDVTGLYPFSLCENWEKLNDDIEYLQKIGAVSFVLVTDPFADTMMVESLTHWKLCTPFKTHFIIDLQQNWRAQRTKNVRNTCNKGLKLNNIEIFEGEPRFADLFWRYYQESIIRHNMTGIQRMSLSIIEKQLCIEGVFLIVSRKDNHVTGAMICINQGKESYLHLMALSDTAYQYKTSYALCYHAIETLENKGCHFVNLGGSAGFNDDPEDGLYQFKRRWANAERKSMLCGEILNPEIYHQLTKTAGIKSNSYFPVYRMSGSQFEWLK